MVIAPSAFGARSASSGFHGSLRDRGDLIRLVQKRLDLVMTGSPEIILSSSGSVMGSDEAAGQSISPAGVDDAQGM
jgi:hypothetical protein